MCFAPDGGAVSFRLQQFGPGDYRPIPVEIMTAIANLPPNAKLAYACGTFEEVSFSDPRLVSIEAHTGRSVVPMCFEADFLSTLLGASASAQVPSAYFESAPQWTLYPDATASPSPERVRAFMKQNGIDYIYADASHLNSLVADAIPIATSGDVSVLGIP